MYHHSEQIEARELCTALGGRWQGTIGRAPCPNCNHRSGRKDEALAIKDGDDRPLIHCHRCNDFPAIADCLRNRGLWRAKGTPAPPKSATRPLKRDLEHPPAPDPDAIKRHNVAIRVWDEAIPLHDELALPARAYLEGRGIYKPEWGWPETLHYHPNAYYEKGEDGLPVLMPALVGKVELNGQMTGIQRLFLSPDSIKAFRAASEAYGPAEALRIAPPQKHGAKMQGAVKGAAVRIGHPILYEPIILVEGIEDALAVHIASGFTAWAALSAGGIANLILPDMTTHNGGFIIFPDGDDAGRRAAAALKDRYPDLSIKITATPSGGDANSLLHQAPTI